MTDVSDTAALADHHANAAWSDYVTGDLDPMCVLYGETQMMVWFADGNPAEHFIEVVWVLSRAAGVTHAVLITEAWTKMGVGINEAPRHRGDLGLLAATGDPSVLSAVLVNVIDFADPTNDHVVSLADLGPEAEPRQERHDHHGVMEGFIATNAEAAYADPLTADADSVPVLLAGLHVTGCVKAVAIMQRGDGTDPAWMRGGPW